MHVFSAHFRTFVGAGSRQSSSQVRLSPRQTSVGGPGRGGDLLFGFLSLGLVPPFSSFGRIVVGLVAQKKRQEAVIERLKKEKEAAELEGCTFSPRISKPKTGLKMGNDRKVSFVSSPSSVSFFALYTSVVVCVSL